MTTNVFKSFNRSVDLVNSVTKKIAVSQLIKKEDRILLSLSGGQDSICLLFVLNQISDQMELHLAFFWCHHLWQIDSFFLMKQIAKLSFLFQFDSCFAIPSHFIFSELLARNWRYNCSYRVSLFYNYSKIGIAHSANDKVETMFLNLMRGTGLSGLSPLRWTQLLLKKPLVNEKIQDHVSQLPIFFVSPFFWSSTSLFLRTFSPSVIYSSYRFPKATIKKQYVQQDIQYCNHFLAKHRSNKYSKPFGVTVFGNTVIPQHYSHYHFQREYNRPNIYYQCVPPYHLHIIGKVWWYVVRYAAKRCGGKKMVMLHTTLPPTFGMVVCGKVCSAVLQTKWLRASSLCTTHIFKTKLEKDRGDPHYRSFAVGVWYVFVPSEYFSPIFLRSSEEGKVVCRYAEYAENSQQKWYVNTVMQSCVIEMLQMIMLKHDPRSNKRTNKKVWKKFWHIWVEYTTQSLKRLTNREGNQIVSFFCCKPNNNETIQNLSCVTRKRYFHVDTVFDGITHKDLYVSSRFFIFQKKFSLRVKRIVFKKFPVHTNAIVGKKERRAKKWFYCVSYTFLKTCSCLTN